MKILQSIVLLVLGLLFTTAGISNITKKANAENKVVSVSELNPIIISAQSVSPSSCNQNLHAPFMLSVPAVIIQQVALVIYTV